MGFVPDNKLIRIRIRKREIGLKLFGLDGSFPGFRRATTRACLQRLGKRCVLRLTHDSPAD